MRNWSAITRHCSNMSPRADRPSPRSTPGRSCRDPACRPPSPTTTLRASTSASRSASTSNSLSSSSLSVGRPAHSTTERRHSSQPCQRPKCCWRNSRRWAPTLASSTETRRGRRSLVGLPASSIKLAARVAMVVRILPCWACSMRPLSQLLDHQRQAGQEHMVAIAGEAELVQEHARIAHDGVGLAGQDAVIEALGQVGWARRRTGP